MQYFQYGEKEKMYLIEKEPILGEEIKKIGHIQRKINPNLFEELISSIISQQISTKAAVTVKKRLLELIGEINPQNIAKADVEAIQKCGMSLRKANYIKGIGEASISNKIDFKILPQLEDREVIEKLTSLKGVGEWTAEMLLIHALQRPNILSYKDLGIRRGMMKLYDVPQISKETFEVYRDLYTPYGTVASLYLWKISAV
jgi:DNA-3-methyladenine glycosylase II